MFRGRIILSKITEWIFINYLLYRCKWDFNFTHGKIKNSNIFYKNNYKNTVILPENTYSGETIFNLRKINTEQRISNLERRILTKCQNKRFFSGGIWKPVPQGEVKKFRTSSRPGEEKEDFRLWKIFENRLRQNMHTESEIFWFSKTENLSPT